MMQSGKRPRWRPVRAIFREGIEAALAAEPYFLATTKTRTTLGWVVRELVLDAGRGKLEALKAMLVLLDREPSEEEEDEEAGRILNEPRWDWTPERVWEGRPETEEELEAKEEAARTRDAIIAEIEDGSAKAELLRRLRRREAFKEEERQRQAKRAEAAASGSTADPPAPTMAPPDDGATWVETNGSRFRLGTRP